MPLGPVPPPSPRGKKVPPPKHTCPLDSPCPIRVSDAGKRYHSFPRGSFCARFTPPSFPRHVLRHFAIHPPTWSWTRKDGLDKDRTSQAPTFPISYRKVNPKAVRWVCHIFHSFRAHLSESSFEADSGRVKKGILLIYQNNMLVHLRGQLGHPVPFPPQNSPPKPGGPPSAPATPPSVKSAESLDLVAIVREMRAELDQLKEEVQALTFSLTASSPPPSPTAAHSPTI
ncbi:hypothetical protein JVT61DRAFT_13706 [Boletus reticuloceps]|uniref:Uncharacterized protein n=1 Tax=Boletus reticuloceps TaxID=495285 RepID=A0A8I2YUT0_9AGAM|nr:hypothetical protein JVT61DRAFT_13706 [Boletus reticuloceps]